MTVTFSFDHALTPEVLAAINELNRLAQSQGQGQAARQAVVNPAPTNNTTKPAPAPSKPDAPARLLTEADVRAAMDAAKARIWGVNHATDPALTKEAKAPLVEAFKAVARIYGAEKPSLLPDHTARANFIRHIETLNLGPDGAIVEDDMPF